MEPNSQPAAPPAPDTNTPVVEPAAPAAAPAPVEQAPRTIDPVDHSAPVVDPAAPVADPQDPVVDPAAPDPVDPDAPAPDETGDDLTVNDIVADTPVDDDPVSAAIQAKQEAGEDLPSGINPDGTVDPLVYAYENMPTIKVLGKEGTKGEVKEYEVKTAEDLPDDFRYANSKVQAKFLSDLQQNMNVARELMTDAQQYNSTKTEQASRRAELVSQKNELDALIKDGKLPQIVAKPTDPNFMDDPGAKRAQQVLDHMKELNAEFEKLGSTQRVTSVTLALRDLEAKEAIEEKNARMGGIVDTRNSINNKISNGSGSAPAPAPHGSQRVHKDVNSAIRFARKQHGI